MSNVNVQSGATTINKSFDQFDNAGDGLHKSDGHISLDNIKYIVNNPSRFSEEEVKGAKMLLNDAHALRKLDGADGKHDGYITRAGIASLVDEYEKAAAAKAKEAPTKNPAPNRSSEGYQKSQAGSSDKAGSTSSSGTSGASVRQELDAMREAYNKDLQKKGGVPWNCDDMARNLVNQHPEKLKNMGTADKALLMQLLRDAGSGKYASINAADRKAMLAVLNSATPDERAKILDAAGGAEEFAKHFKGDELASFKQLTGYKGEGGGTKTGSANTDGKPPASSSTNSGDSSQSAEKSTSNQGSVDDANYGSGSMQQDLVNASKEVSTLWDKYRSLKIGDKVKDYGEVTKDNIKDIKNSMMQEIQAAQQWKMQLNQFATTMLKKQHEMAMAIIRNMA